MIPVILSDLGLPVLIVRAGIPNLRVSAFVGPVEVLFFVVPPLVAYIYAILAIFQIGILVIEFLSTNFFSGNPFKPTR